MFRLECVQSRLYRDYKKGVAEIFVTSYDVENISREAPYADDRNIPERSRRDKQA